MHIPNNPKVSIVETIVIHADHIYKIYNGTYKNDLCKVKIKIVNNFFYLVI